MSQDIREKIRAYLSQNRDTIVGDVAELCRIPSERSPAAPGAPFGAACAQAVQAAADKAAAMGFEAAVYADQGYALAYSGAGEKTIGFFGHCDVVPAGTGWTLTAPYEPREIEGTLVARGAGDNKNGVMAGLWAMKAVRDLGLPVKSRLMTFMGGDEESGMEDAEAFAKAHPMPDLCIIPDAGFPVCNGEKGILEATLRCTRPFKDILSLDGGLAPNVIIGEAEARVRRSDTLLARLEALTAGRPEYTLEASAEVIILKAVGRSGHASEPDGSLNAARLLAEVLMECDIDPQDRQTMEDVATALSDDYAEAMGFAAQDAQSGRTTATCGIAKTVDGHLSLTFNPRYCVTMEGDFFIQGFKGFFEPRGWEATYFHDSKGYFIPTDDSRVQSLMQIYRDLTGDTEAQPYVMGGGTYARKLKNALAFGPNFEGAQLPYTLPAGHGGAHQPDEALGIDNFIRAIELYVVALVEVDKVL